MKKSSKSQKTLDISQKIGYDEEKYDLSMYNKADIYFSEESARRAVKEYTNGT